jgi:hypothetical protein
VLRAAMMKVDREESIEGLTAYVYGRDITPKHHNFESNGWTVETDIFLSSAAGVSLSLSLSLSLHPRMLPVYV